MEKMEKLDFRFADEFDIEELLTLINQSCAIEHDPSSSLSFRVPALKMETSELIDNFSSPNYRWLVVETPHPEELMVGAARFYKNENNAGVLEYFCSSVNDNEKMQYLILKLLLGKCEVIAKNLNCDKMILPIVQWRVDQQTLLESCGYIDSRGYSYPEDKINELSKPTMILEYEKDLIRDYSVEHELKKTENDSVDSILGELDFNDVQVENKDIVMNNLVEDLFQALHISYGHTS